MNQQFISILACCLILAAGSTASGRSELRQGEEAYRNGDFPASSGYFGEALAKDPENLEAHFDLGASAYRQGDLDAAASRFARVAQSGDPAWAGKGWYNLGNTRLEQQDPAGAVEAYVQALKNDSSLDEARWNLELAQQMLEQQQQQQQENGQDSQDGQDPQDQESGQDQQSDKGDKGQQPQDQDSQSGQGNGQDQPQAPDPSQEPGAEQEGQQAQQGEPQDQADQLGDSTAAAQAMPISPEQLEQILQAISQQEKAALARQLENLPSNGRRVEKDW
ncbi:MAG: tetratricopeptide repeat protein [Calditrichaeota bacterium]|nr:tetratricopeptide repeat protein [Candidatus Cloacimonadota bacterium]MCA9787075.1 tetratricopeptide repeat protein [Candidatus Cloacimonadota bacterium]MCB1046562.1 tetratricopeptide repeat protein [Calditrichota bacterium]MCB9474776.1 tetratricopeptide repeat protein [Candidatus Delongbacteria bacterium]